MIDARLFNRYIPPDVKIVERNGIIFFVHPRRRYDPITLAAIAVGGGTGLQIAGTLKAGKQAEEIAEARAKIDIQNAEAVREAAVEKAKIKAEKGRRDIETQISQAAASNIRINVGSPLVIKAESRDIITRNIGFVLERGREEEQFFRTRAGIERATGKAAKRKSRFDAISQGLLGFGSLAFGGLKTPKTNISRVTTSGFNPNLPVGTARTRSALGF